MLQQYKQMNNEHALLINYLRILEDERKFKAKVIYTLNCIHSYLGTASPNQLSALHMLSQYANLLQTLMTLHSDSSILQQVTLIFSKLQTYQICPIATTSQFLNNLMSLQAIEDIQLTDPFFQSLSAILYSLRHEYAQTKKFCLKLIKNKKIRPLQQEIFVDIIRKYSCATMEDCLQLSQAGVQAEILLKLMWIICKQRSSPLNKKLAEQIIGESLDRNWHDEKFKYQSVMAAVACAINEQGVVDALMPSFINQFYRKNPKPLYPGVAKTMNDDKFRKILEHFAKEAGLFLFQFKTQQWGTRFSQLGCNQEQISTLQTIIQKNEMPTYIIKKIKQDIPIILLSWNHCDIIFEKLIKQPNLYNCLCVVYKLKNSGQALVQKKQMYSICLFLLQTYLTHKSQVFLKNIQLSICALIKNFNTFIAYAKSNSHYILFLPTIIHSLADLPATQSQTILQIIDTYLSSEQSSICYQFYLAWACIKWKYKSGISKFSNFLLRKLNRERLPYEQICYYLRKSKWEQDDITWLQENFQQEMESILQKIFVRLTDEDFKQPKLIVFGLDKYGIFKEWSATYRWVLNPLDEPLFSSPEAALDSLEVFETVVENCTNTPFDLIKRFFAIVAKNWENYNHEHMFAIERISNSLFSRQMSSSDLQAISAHLKSLCNRPWPSSNFRVYQLSFDLLIKITLMQQTSGIQEKIKKQLKKWASSQNIDTQPYKSYSKLKQSLFCLVVMLWVYQSGDEVIDDMTGQLVMKIINNFHKIEIINESNKQTLVYYCLKIMSDVPHNCNLLGLQLNKVLLRYMNNVNIVSCVVGIISSVKQANPKAISKFKLQTAIPQILCMLLTSINAELNEICIQLLQLLWQAQSPYHRSRGQNIQLLIEIIRSEIIFLTDAYRPQLVGFVLSAINQLGLSGNVPDQWIKLIWLKYGEDKQIGNICTQAVPTLKQEVRLQQVKKNNLQNIKEQLKKQEEIKVQNNKNKQEKIIQYVPVKLKAQEKVIFQQVQPKEQKTQVVNLDVLPENKVNPSQKQTVQVQQFKLKEQETKVKNQKQDIKDIIKAEINQPQPEVKQSTVVIKESTQTHSPARAQLAPNVKPNPLGGRKKVILNQQQGQLVNNIKGYIVYIESLADIEINSQQQQQLLTGIKYLGESISTHSYYCQKAVNLGLVTKCLKLTEKTQSLVLKQLLGLFLIMSSSKDKNLLIFHDKQSIDFFKKQLKKSIDARKQLPENKDLILIVENCWASSKEFFAGGLLSMLFEMCKLNLNKLQVLELLADSELSYQIINQIYQRGLFNMMKQTLTIDNKNLKQEEKIEICLWAKLIGKVCLNKSIREKMFSIQVHILTWQKLSIFQQKGCVQNLAFLYSSFCYEFEKLASWAMSQKIPEYFLSHIKTYNGIIPFEYYKFYRYFSQNGTQFIIHLIRIKLHDHLLETIPVLSNKLKFEGYKHFYKCLSHMFIPDYYQYFIKAEIIRLLVEKYTEDHCSHSLECLQKLVDQLQDRRQLEVLGKQNLYSLNCVFNSKLKDDPSYQHVLQIYIILFKKFKKFNYEHINLELVHKITRKSIFSINMEGMKKALQFFIRFSNVDKVCYGNANCMRLIELLLAYDVKDEDYDLVYQYLEVQAQYNLPSRSTQQLRTEQQEKYPLRFKKVIDIPCENLLQSLFAKVDELVKQIEMITSEAKEKPQRTLSKIIKILKFFTKNEQNSLKIFEKVGSLLMRPGKNLCSYGESLEFLNQLLSWTIMGSRSLLLEDLTFSYLNQAANQISLKSKTSSSANFNVLASVAQKCLKNNFITPNNFDKLVQKYPTLKKAGSTNQKTSRKPKLSEEAKKKMKTGIKVKMYKPDGSNSNLLFFFSVDLFEIHCASSTTEVVKGKWKMPLNQVAEIREFSKEEDFKKSVFYLAEGIFSKAPEMKLCLRLVGNNNSFHICFDTAEQLNEWKQYIEQARQSVRQILTKVS